VATIIFLVIQSIKLPKVLSHLVIVDVELLVGIDEQENVSEIRIAAALLEALLQLLDHDVLGQVPDPPGTWPQAPGFALTGGKKLKIGEGEFNFAVPLGSFLWRPLPGASPS
jgi:hypothetical protein